MKHVFTIPSELVTALRIIEMIGRSSLTGFLPPGRRKKWREVCIDKLANIVELKMEGRGEIKMGLLGLGGHPDVDAEEGLEDC